MKEFKYDIIAGLCAILICICTGISYHYDCLWLYTLSIPFLILCIIFEYKASKEHKERYEDERHQKIEKQSKEIDEDGITYASTKAFPYLDNENHDEIEELIHQTWIEASNYAIKYYKKIE